MCAALLIALAVIFGSPSAFNGITPTRSVTQPLRGPAAPAASRPVPAPALPAAARTAPRPSSTVPAPVRVTLHGGDTLWALSRSHGTTVATLQTLNALGHRTLIYAGHTLLIPVASMPVPAAPWPPHAPAPGAVNATHAQAPSGAAAAIAFAERQLGVPYLWGGTGAGGYDCSGLIQAAWHAAGVDLPRTTYEQVNAGTRITRARLQPGDLVFSNHDGHIQMYIGQGTVIEAPHTGAFVRYTPLPPDYQVDAYVRISAAR
jgi:cell wall-associated NlpC family hydrolase